MKEAVKKVAKVKSVCQKTGHNYQPLSNPTWDYSLTEREGMGRQLIQRVYCTKCLRPDKVVMKTEPNYSN